MTLSTTNLQIKQKSLQDYDIAQPNDEQVAALRACIKRQLMQSVSTIHAGLINEDPYDRCIRINMEPSVPVKIFGAEHEARVILVDVGRSYYAGPSYVKSAVLKAESGTASYHLLACRAYDEDDGSDEWTFSNVVLVGDADDDLHLLEDQPPSVILAQFAV